VFTKTGRTSQALKSFHHAVNVGREISGLDPLLLASCLSNLGDALRKQGDLERAEPCLDEALRLYKAAGNANGGQIAKLLVRIGRTKRRRKRFGEAAALFEEAFTLGLDYDPETTPATFARQIGRTHSLDGNLNEAHKWYRKAYTLHEAQGDTRETDFIILSVEMAEVALKQNDDVGAESVFRKVLMLQESGVACPDRYAARLLCGIGEIEERRSNLEEAAQCYGRARTIYRNLHGEDHPDVARQMTHMGRCFYRLGRGFEAVATIVYAERILSDRLGSNHRDTRRARELLEQLRG
jgi:tetratricopeptide (TPR) repeat protein